VYRLRFMDCFYSISLRETCCHHLSLCSSFVQWRASSFCHSGKVTFKIKHLQIYTLSDKWQLQQILFYAGVLLAILEKASVISPVINSLGQSTSAGTVSAGYQNFLICIEMLFAAIALRYAFPYQVYAAGCVTDSRGRSVTMQSISSSLKVRIKYFRIF